MEKERLRFMVKISKLYYQEGLNQKEIAKRYGISRPQVSRILSAAKVEGIVEINIRNPFSNETALEKRLVTQFNLTDAVVVDTTDLDQEASNTMFASASSIYLESVINDNAMIGVMAGKSITALINELDEINKKNLKFVPLIGGWGPQEAKWHANTNAIQIAKKAKGSYWVLHAPAIVSSTKMHENLLNEPQIKEVTSLYKNVNIALVGIGQISKDATFFNSMNLKKDELIKLKSEGAVGSIGTTFINQNGEEVSKQYSEKMLGISSEDLKIVPLVVGFAKGEEKLNAIQAALEGKWLDVLVTDLKTATQIIHHNKLKEEMENEKN